MSSSAALASTAEPAISTVKPTSPSFDLKMPDSRSSSSITRRRTTALRSALTYRGSPSLRQFYDVSTGAGDYADTRLDRRDGPRLLARRRVLRRHRSLRIAHQEHHADTDRDCQEGERVEGRGIAQPADQEAGDDRAGRLADVPDRSEHAHGSAEAPCRSEIGDQRVGHRRHRGDAQAENRCHYDKSYEVFASEDQRKRSGA